MQTVLTTPEKHNRKADLHLSSPAQGIHPPRSLKTCIGTSHRAIGTSPLTQSPYPPTVSPRCRPPRWRSTWSAATRSIASSPVANCSVPTTFQSRRSPVVLPRSSCIVTTSSPIYTAGTSWRTALLPSGAVLVSRASRTATCCVTASRGRGWRTNNGGGRRRSLRRWGKNYRVSRAWGGRSGSCR
jgi:hypothetical protein